MQQLTECLKNCCAYRSHTYHQAMTTLSLENRLRAHCFVFCVFITVVWVAYTHAPPSGHHRYDSCCPVRLLKKIGDQCCNPNWNCRPRYIFKRVIRISAGLGVDFRLLTRPVRWTGQYKSAHDEMSAIFAQIFLYLLVYQSVVKKQLQQSVYTRYMGQRS